MICNNTLRKNFLIAHIRFFLPFTLKVHTVQTQFWQPDHKVPKNQYDKKQNFNKFIVLS